MFSTARLKMFKCTWIKCLLETNLASSMKPSNYYKKEERGCNNYIPSYAILKTRILKSIMCGSCIRHTHFFNCLIYNSCLLFLFCYGCARTSGLCSRYAWIVNLYVCQLLFHEFKLFSWLPHCIPLGKYARNHNFMAPKFLTTRNKSFIALSGSGHFLFSCFYWFHEVCSTSEAGLLRYQVAWAVESIEDRPRHRVQRRCVCR